MEWSVRTLTPAADIPAVVDLDEAKRHLNIVGMDDDDTLITKQIRAAQEFIEGQYGQVLTPRSMELAVRGFPLRDCDPAPCWRDGGFVIPREPVTGIAAIAYLDAEGVAAELVEADWRWSESSPELVRAAIGASWPRAYDEDGSVRITFDAGYEEGLAPDVLTASVKLALGDLYAHREETITGTIVNSMKQIEALCRRFHARRTVLV